MKLDILRTYGHIKPSTSLGGVMKNKAQTWFLREIDDMFVLHNENASRIRVVSGSREPISLVAAKRLIRQDFKDRGYRVIGMDRVVVVTVVPVRPSKKSAPKKGK